MVADREMYYSTKVALSKAMLRPPTCNQPGVRMVVSIRHVSILAIFCTTACSDSKPPLTDTYLKCTGTISSLGNSSSLIKNQQIAVRISGGTISFSGNSMLLGEHIPICPAGSNGRSEDDVYFDSESCVGTRREDPRRRYGTYNRILGTVELTNTIENQALYSISGTFECTPATPVQ